MFDVVARIATSVINVAFVAALLAEPFRKPRPLHEQWGYFLLRAGVAVIAATVLADLGKRFAIWPGHPTFPSGHTAFAAAAAVMLVRQRGAKWIAPGVLLVSAMMWGLVRAGYHSVIDVIGGLGVGVLVSLSLGLWPRTVVATGAAVRSGAPLV